jgi:DNA-directed RNA polymerase subunit L
MTTIKNKSEKIQLDLSPDKVLQRVIDGYSKNKGLSFLSKHMTKNKEKITADLKKLLPTNNPLTYKFDIINSNTMVANAFRRVYKTELPVWYLTCKFEDFESDDPKILRSRDYIIQRFNAIPIDQEAAAKIDESGEIPALQFVLEASNEDTNTLLIEDKTTLSSDISLYERISDKWVKADNNQKYFSFGQTIRIAHIMKSKKVRIRLFLTNTDSEKLDTLSRGSYTFKPLEYKEPYPESFSVHPKDYELSITSNGHTNNLWYINRIWDSILYRLNRLQESFEDAKKLNKVPYVSDILAIEKSKGEENKFKYKLFNETRTIGNLIAWYTFKQDETGFINCGDDHPKDPFIVMIVKQYKDHLNIVIKGTAMAISEISNIKKQFNK